MACDPPADQQPEAALRSAGPASKKPRPRRPFPHEGGSLYRLPADVVADMKAEAHRLDATVSWVVRLAIRIALPVLRSTYPAKPTGKLQPVPLPPAPPPKRKKRPPLPPPGVSDAGVLAEVLDQVARPADRLPTVADLRAAHDHQPDLLERVVAAVRVADGPVSCQDVVDATGLAGVTVRSRLTFAVAQKLVVRVARNSYVMPVAGITPDIPRRIQILLYIHAGVRRTAAIGRAMGLHRDIIQDEIGSMRWHRWVVSSPAGYVVTELGRQRVETIRADMAAGIVVGRHAVAAT